MSPDDRMDKLQAMLEHNPDDTFLLYGLANEYKKINDTAKALQYLDRVTQIDPGYAYAFYQRGLIYEAMGDVEAAREAYRQGIAAADRKGDAHAREELQAALDLIQ